MTGYHPGAMGDKSDKTEPPEFAGSLAAGIEQHLHDYVLADAGASPFPLTGNSPDDRARRALFVAIARGVIEHLQTYADQAFVITLDGTGTYHVQIKVDVP